MNKPKCPKCNEEATLILNEDNFNVMFNMIDGYRYGDMIKTTLISYLYNDTVIDIFVSLNRYDCIKMKLFI